MLSLAQRKKLSKAYTYEGATQPQERSLNQRIYQKMVSEAHVPADTLVNLYDRGSGPLTAYPWNSLLLGSAGARSTARGRVRQPRLDNLTVHRFPTEALATMGAARLTYARRQALPASAFVFPQKRKYPIYDKAHARNALARVSRFGTAAEKRKVCEAVAMRFPDIHLKHCMFH